MKKFDAVALCGGATKPRDLPIPGRELDGIHFAMDFLTQQNHRVSGIQPYGKEIMATGKRVIVIGGGDTGGDCVGASNRQGAKSVTSFELMPMPSEGRPDAQPWPYWPMRLRAGSSHKEGGRRFWSILTKKFMGAEGRLRSLMTINVEPIVVGGGLRFQEVAGTEHEWPAELVLLALGFVGPEPNGVIAQLGVERDPFGNVKSDGNYMTNAPGVFVAGDMRRGQSLVVWAISEGREAARGVDLYLMGHSELPTKGNMDIAESVRRR